MGREPQLLAGAPVARRILELQVETSHRFMPNCVPFRTSQRPARRGLISECEHHRACTIHTASRAHRQLGLKKKILMPTRHKALRTTCLSLLDWTMQLLNKGVDLGQNELGYTFAMSFNNFIQVTRPCGSHAFYLRDAALDFAHRTHEKSISFNNESSSLYGAASMARHLNDSASKPARKQLRRRHLKYDLIDIEIEDAGFCLRHPIGEFVLFSTSPAPIYPLDAVCLDHHLGSFEDVCSSLP